MRRFAAAGGLLLVALLPVTPAAAGPLEDYKNTGTIPRCKYSDQQLAGALGGVPPDIQQYAPGFADGLSDARGAPCGGGPAGTSTPTAGDRASQVPGLPSAGGGGGSQGQEVPKPPAPEPAKRVKVADVAAPALPEPKGSDVPTWVTILLAAALVGAVGIGLGRFAGLSAAPAGRLVRASFAEAGGRISDRATQVWETVRLGR